MAFALLALPATTVRAEPDRVMATSMRQVEPLRPVSAQLPQVHIASSIELGRIMFPSGGGGGLGSIIIAGNNDIPMRLAENAIARAEGWIAPLRAALGDFDAAALAGEASRAVLANTEWLGVSPPQLLTLSADGLDGVPQPVIVSRTYHEGLWGATPNPSEAEATWVAGADALQRQFAEANTEAAELTQIQWRYQMSPDFTLVQVFADVSVRRRGMAEPLFTQQLISVVRLNRPSFVEEENVARWAADDAALARRALTMAFARAGEVLPHLLALDEAGFAQLTDGPRETATAAGYHGPVLLRDATGTVFWAEDGDQRLAAFVTVQLIRE